MCVCVRACVRACVSVCLGAVAWKASTSFRLNFFFLLAIFFTSFSLLFSISSSLLFSISSFSLFFSLPPPSHYSPPSISLFSPSFFSLFFCPHPSFSLFSPSLSLFFCPLPLLLTIILPLPSHYPSPPPPFSLFSPSFSLLFCPLPSHYSSPPSFSLFFSPLLTISPPPSHYSSAPLLLTILLPSSLFPPLLLTILLPPSFSLSFSPLLLTILLPPPSQWFLFWSAVKEFRKCDSALCDLDTNGTVRFCSLFFSVWNHVSSCWPNGLKLCFLLTGSGMLETQKLRRLCSEPKLSWRVPSL